MRHKRSKTYRRALTSYILHFGYRPPFQLLVDASFTLSLSALHLSAQEADKRLSDVLQTSQLNKGKTKAGTPEMKCMITQCCMVELYAAEKEGQLQKDAVAIAKAWERRKCNHREAIPGDQCLKEVIGATNKHRYMLASDTRSLRRHLNAEVAGIPLIHTNQSRVIVLEPMSDITKARIQELEHAKFTGSADNPASLPGNVISNAHQGDDSSTPTASASTSTSAPSQPTPFAAPTKKPKQANPLSNKKPKKVLEAERAEKARRTREIAERTEAKKRAREAEQSGQAGESVNSVRPNRKRTADDAEREPAPATKPTPTPTPTSSAKSKAQPASTVTTDDGPSQKKRKRGGRGGSSAKKAKAGGDVSMDGAVEA